VIKKILFTKSIPSTILKNAFDDNVEVVCQPTLQIDFNTVNTISQQIDFSIEQYIVSSQNTVEAIRELDLKGDFFVVGKKTAEKLIAQNRNVILVEDYAEDLAEKLISNNYSPKWNFLCGSSRRETLIKLLIEANHHVNQVTTYYSEQISYQLEEYFDVYTFFSPLSFNAFHQKNAIPKTSCIFTVGKTTTSAIQKKYPEHTIITADIPLIETVIENIKKYIDDKK